MCEDCCGIAVDERFHDNHEMVKNESERRMDRLPSEICLGRGKRGGNNGSADGQEDLAVEAIFCK